ncbi:hypothetical protein D9M72_524470 [compost metagenome]
MSPLPASVWQARAAAARGSSRGGPNSRWRAVMATVNAAPASAASIWSTMTAPASTSSAPLAMAMASACRSTSGSRGETSTRLPKPMVLIARATEPTLPGWLVSTSTKRTRPKASPPVSLLLPSAAGWLVSIAGFIYNSGFFFGAAPGFCLLARLSRHICSRTGDARRSSTIRCVVSCP